MKKIKYYTLVFFVCLLVACKPIDAASVSGCESNFFIPYGAENTVSTTPDNRVIRDLEPSFFGFNLEWVDFQQDMFDRNANQVWPNVVEWMKPFAGAVYRYPGGTGSNHLDWHDTVGPQSSRPKKQRVDWLGPIAAQFGFDEYLDFVKKTNGTAWVVLNLNGDYAKEGDHASLAKSAADWVSYANRAKLEGMPEVLRWELGNELDRYKWKPNKYVQVANQTMKAVLASEPEAKFVSLLQDYAFHKEYSVSQYDSILMNELTPKVNDYAHHLYYEEQSWGSVFERMSYVCKSVEDAHKAKIDSPSIWITEHAKGEQVQDKRNWIKTSNLEAAIVEAESYIAAAQLPEVKGLFLHSLGTSHGPWPLFNSGMREELRPSIVYWAMRILRDTMLPKVLASQVASRNEEGSIGDHDVRAVVLTDAQQLQYVVWAVNRYGQVSKLAVKIPALSGKAMHAYFTYISDSNKLANNFLVADNVVPQHLEKNLIFNEAGVAEVELPAYSVNALRITPR